jgi:hypothetical protein
MTDATDLHTETGRVPGQIFGLGFVIWFDCHLQKIVLSLPIIAMLGGVILFLLADLTSARAAAIASVVIVALMIAFFVLVAVRNSGLKKRASLAYLVAIDRQVKSAERAAFNMRLMRLLSCRDFVARCDVTTALIGVQKDGREVRRMLQDRALRDAHIAVLRRSDPMDVSRVS